MTMLVFMPWCRIDADYRMGEVSIAAYRTADEASAELDGATREVVRTILSCYRDLDGRAVSHAALLRYGDRPVLGDLSESELEVAYELAALGCFAGLAKRELLGFAYCNADCFILYGQRFEQLDHIALVARRRDGRTWSARELAKTTFSEPVHTSSVERVSLDGALLGGLLAFRGAASPEDWARWQNALSCFNQANTDNDAVRYQTEWTLMASAFEQLLDAEPKAESVAAKFKEVLAPNASLLVRDARRRNERMRTETEALRYEWMKEFYRLRGAFAHGRLDPKQPAAWQPLEHLALAAIAFPLVVRSLLTTRGTYTLTDDDISHIDAFERLADVDFFKLPEDAKGSTDTVWARLVRAARGEVVKRRAVKDLEKLMES
jgi:hypothetical protein